MFEDAGTAFQVNVGVVEVVDVPSVLVVPGPSIVGTGNGVGTTAAAVWKYKYALSVPVVDPSTTRRFQTNVSPPGSAVGTVKLVAVAAI